ncbi:MAG: winged helix-turn-helix domain-containing protein [Blastocatellia bacterium]|nr:winged helix-turn-helix domain-containing protein [Blastocatellia bacterium]
MLVFLVQNGGRVISKDEILSDIWKDQFVEESNLAVQISALRKVLGDQTTKSRFLATIPGKGYQFIADVSYVGSAAETIATEPLPVDVLQPPPIKPSRRGTMLVMVVSAAVLLIAGYFAVQFFLIGDRDEVRSVAVLPFVNQTVSPSPEYLGDGLAEGIIFSLPGFPVYG